MINLNNTTILFFLCIFCLFEAHAIGIDYSKHIDEGFSKNYFFGQDGGEAVWLNTCSFCDKLEPGKNDWVVRIGSDIIYGAAACSTVPTGTPHDAFDASGGFGKFYKPSLPIKDKILHTYEDNGFYCYCSITQFNDTVFNNPAWLYLNGGFSKYTRIGENFIDDLPNEKINELLKSNLNVEKYNERINNLTYHCRETCASDCYRVMSEATFRAEMYKNVNIQDTGTRCIKGVVYIPHTKTDKYEQEQKSLVGVNVYSDTIDGKTKETQTDGEGRFKICDIQGDEVFSTLIGPPFIVCDLITDNDVDLLDYIDKDSEITFWRDCSRAIEKENENDCIKSGGEYKDGKCECDSEIKHLIPNTFSGYCKCEDDNKKFDLAEQVCKDRSVENEKTSSELINLDEINTETDDSIMPENNDSNDYSKLNSLQKTYENIHTIEQSLPNRTLTALTTAATGIGGMELAQGLAEKWADAAADADMAAYIETFRCTYADGKSVKGGPDPIELPGGNDDTIFNLRQQYFSLATSLKERKESLGLSPGIESEVILDKATMGLYMQENTGISGGVYSSLYRAKMLGSETDQAKINEDKEKSEKRVKAGAVAAGAGVIGGIAGNYLINSETDKK